ncbi:preprotein translocase subunit Sec61beta [Candidatus Woesearchaeota archaeon]|nr:preprotein translocase subunit Sec61beta [Candidatus Woesearchaeota archaeon]
MAKDNKIQMPSGMGGIVRYFDDYKSKIEIKPGHVLVLIVLIIIIMLFLNTYGRTWFGI